MTSAEPSALAKFRDQVRIARDTGNFVVQTVDEAQAVIDEIENPISGRLRCLRCGNDQTIQFAYATISAPPHEGDDEHA